MLRIAFAAGGSFGGGRIRPGQARLTLVALRCSVSVEVLALRTFFACGGRECVRPKQARAANIAAALGVNVQVLAMRAGAAMGNFVHDFDDAIKVLLPLAQWGQAAAPAYHLPAC